MTTINEYLLLPPNWNQPVTYRRRWQTTILTSLDANEQRHALLTWPRRTIVFTPLTKNFGESAYLKRKLHKNLQNVWGIPFWQDGTVLTAEAPSDQKILHVKSTNNRNFEAGAPCILFSSYASYEIGTVDLMTPNQITLVSNLSRTWPAGTQVFPVLKCRIKSGQKVDFINSTMGQFEIEASEEFDGNYYVSKQGGNLNHTPIDTDWWEPWVSGDGDLNWRGLWDSETTYGTNDTIFYNGITRRIGTSNGFSTYPPDQGLPVFDLKPDWSEVLGHSFIHPYDYSVFLGNTCSLNHYGETEFAIKFSFLQRVKSQLQTILDFFDSQMGRLGNFWLPSWQGDVRITQPFGSGATQLTIEDIEFTSYWLNTYAGAHITILWPDGTRVNREIVGAPAPTTITLDSAVGKSCPSSELGSLLASFLYLSRFDQDEIEAEYITGETGRVNPSFRTIFTDTPS